MLPHKLTKWVTDNFLCFNSEFWTRNALFYCGKHSHGKTYRHVTSSVMSTVCVPLNTVYYNHFVIVSLRCIIMKICVMWCLRLQCSFAFNSESSNTAPVFRLTKDCWFFFLFLFKELRSCSSLTTDLRLLSKSSWWDNFAYLFNTLAPLHLCLFLREWSECTLCSRVWVQYGSV